MNDLIEAANFSTPLEFLGAAIVIGSTLFMGSLGNRLFRFMMRWIDRVAQYPARAIMGCALLSGIGSAGIAIGVNWPEPRIHDEFSYLLAGDTFLQGRLTNPTHEHWEHFESFHVISEPTYASKYPPGQGLALAAGQLLGGEPLVGVWLSGALMCGAICWMLYGWLPARWALLGGLLALAQFGLQRYWTQSYWGGALAAAGGGLVFGALPRILDKRRIQDSLLLGIGLAILANTRPYEGILASLPVAAVLLFNLIRAPTNAARALVPAAVALLLAASWMAVLNERVSGDPLTMPYAVHDEAYGATPPFLWAEPDTEIEFRHFIMRKFWINWAGRIHDQQQSLSGIWRGIKEKLSETWGFFLGAVLTLPMVFVFRVFRMRGLRLSLVSCVLVLIVSLASTWLKPHYIAPITAPLVLIVTGSLRSMATFRMGRLATGRGGVLGVILLLVLLMSARGLRSAQVTESWGDARDAIQSELEADSDRHLVIVRYEWNHSPHEEWVFNGADIDGAEVIWARDLGKSKNLELIDYFEGRRVWLLEVDIEGAPEGLQIYPDPPR